jgi:predicted acylesterase/phospholipase RssA
MSAIESSAVKRAREVLLGTAGSPAEILALAKELKEEQEFAYARKVLWVARTQKPPDEKTRVRLRQELALCTYKDAELPADFRLDRALEILEDQEENLLTTKDQETLGLAGGIFKRKWELDGQRTHLERSLAYYLRGYDIGVGKDYGYTGINAAYLLDLLASHEEAEARIAGTASETARSRRSMAKKVREDILTVLPSMPELSGTEWLEQQWWFLATLVEAAFGLERFVEARPWLERAMTLPKIPAWQMESTARQLASLARLKEGQLSSAARYEDSEAWQVLREFFGDSIATAQSISRGKIGLALSGGGFRASFFHIGVLAKLAEFDVLRSIEVLSCVSGGSIVGAHYYLKVRRLLQAKPDTQAALSRTDYLRIVQQMTQEFIGGVERNIRTRVAAEFWTNFKMMFLPHYSRTRRAGELYEKEIYSRAGESGAARQLWLNQLRIEPLDSKGEPRKDFQPKYHNWRRHAKVPILVLNATTLNTGHNWQFTATWMGEPPAGINSRIDGNERLRRMYYWQAPPNYQRIRLGDAVAASACVPGIFEPLSFAGLYPDRTVRLVDGGVHDNQGIQSLLEQGCTVLLVSDASGQMGAENHPSGGILGVPLRANSILQARVRASQYDQINGRQRASLVRGLMFVHLKKDLEVQPVDWLNCDEPPDPSVGLRPGLGPVPLTGYGIRKDIQRLVSAIRTDLDSFTEAEAFSLMTSGYCMTETEFPKSIQDFSHPTGKRSDWRFLVVEDAMKRQAGSERLERQLRAASDVAFKVWKLVPGLRYSAWSLAIVTLALLAWFRPAWWPVIVLSVTLGMVATAVLGLVGNRIFGPSTMRLVRYRKTAADVLLGFGMCTVGWIAARMHLHVFDKLFLWQGRIKRVI